MKKIFGSLFFLLLIHLFGMEIYFGVEYLATQFPNVELFKFYEVLTLLGYGIILIFILRNIIFVSEDFWERIGCWTTYSLIGMIIVAFLILINYLFIKYDFGTWLQTKISELVVSFTTIFRDLIN